MADNAIAVAATPLFFGTDAARRNQKGAIAPEEFLQRMDSLRAVNGWTEEQSCTRAIANLRDEAWTWYNDYIKHPLSGVDYARFTTDWNFFCQHFKRAFFRERDERDTLADIHDLRQQQGESVRSYIMRLVTAWTPISRLAYNATIDGHTGQEIFNTYAPEALANWIAAPFADGPHALTAAQLTTRIRELSMSCFTGGVRTRENHVGYEQVTRAAARGVREDRMKTYIKGIMLQCGKDFNTFLDRVCEEERKHLPLATRRERPSGHKVNQVDEDDADADEPSDNSDDETEEVDAIGRGGRFNKSQKGKKGKKGKEQNKYDPTKFKCGWCQLNSHNVEDCRKLRSHLQSKGCKVISYKADSQQQDGAKRQKKKWTPRQTTSGDEPMDTSKVDIAALAEEIRQMKMERANAAVFSNPAGFYSQPAPGNE